MATQTLSRASGAATRARDRYAPGIDGLRAFAVLAVFGYHAGIPGLRGGFLGVDIFFVISGYLITDLLVGERHRTGTVDLRQFWVRRARRLLPALAVMVTAVTAAAVLVDRAQLAGLRGDLIAAATYTSNWHQISAHTSYFAQFGPQPLLLHLWSLAVEEQFYLLWPLLLLALPRFVRLHGRQAMLMLAGAVASTVAMALAFTPGSDPSRLYYGTDTHAAGLLVGATLALVLAGRRPNIDLAGGCCLGGLLLAAILATDSGGFVFRGGFLLVSVLAAGAVAAVAAPTGTLGRLLGVAPLRWLGTRSYAIYLWHWPLLCLLHAPGDHPVRIAAALALSLLCAELSWRLVEDPVRRQGLHAALNVVRTRPLRSAPITRLVAGGSVVAVALVACVGVALPPPRDGAQAQIEAGERVVAAQPTPAPSPAPTATTRTHRPGATAPAVPGTGVTAVGDSVMLAAASALRTRLPGISINARIGRQMETATRIVATLRSTGQLGSVVVIDLGTNGEFTQSTLARLMSTIGPTRKVVLLTVYEPRTWQNAVNATVRAAPGRWPNVTVVDWNSAIAHRQQLLWDDHIHPRPGGAKLYAQLVAAALPRPAR